MQRWRRRNWTSTIILSAVLLLLATTAQAFGVGGYFQYGNTEHSDKLGFGAAIDTNLAKNRLVNYRLTVGYEYIILDFGFDSYSTSGISINNTLGFGLYKNSSMRLWIDPAIRLNYDDVNDAGIGVGPEFGINFHIGNRLSAGGSLSYQYMQYMTVSDKDSNDHHLVTLGITLFFRTAGDRYN